VSLSDTVGFIRDLPHTLVDAFQATLQEAADADLLLHVVDAASPVWLDQIREVQRVLHEIGADDVAQVLVFNKIDAMESAQRPRASGDLYELAPGLVVPRWFVSARTGEGLPALRQAIAEAALNQDRMEVAGRTDPRFDPDRSDTDVIEIEDTTPERVETLPTPPTA
jgi:GTP-binding protein HflX